MPGEQVLLTFDFQSVNIFISHEEVMSTWLSLGVTINMRSEQRLDEFFFIFIRDFKQMKMIGQSEVRK